MASPVAQYTDLTAEQKNIVDDWLPLLNFFNREKPLDTNEKREEASKHVWVQVGTLDQDAEQAHKAGGNMSPIPYHRARGAPVYIKDNYFPDGITYTLLDGRSLRQAQKDCATKWDRGQVETIRRHNTQYIVHYMRTTLRLSLEPGCAYTVTNLSMEASKNSDLVGKLKHIELSLDLCKDIDKEEVFEGYSEAKYSQASERLSMTAVPGTQRTFGGRLTTNANADENAVAGLSADAPDFVPGQPVPQRAAPTPKQKKPQYPSAPKSTAADLPTRIHEDISHGHETDYGSGWSCKEICGDMLPCGEHFCATPCHPGLCGSCEVPMQARCYCGKEHKEIPCDRRGDLEMSFNHGQVSSVDSEDVSEESWFDGSFDCGANCGRKYDCGIHECEKSCHPQDEVSAHCPFSPDVVLDCPCGKTPLGELLDQPRQSCEDKIPHCKKTCGKTLGDIATPMCMKVCQAQLNCGRHKCGEHCCPGEKRAIERQAAKRKHRQQAAEEVEAEHICVRVCGRTLKCGTHQCSQICHSGPCPSCLEAVFEEISCACGRTVLQPPQPCGTRPPECRFDCTRAPPCGHPSIKHNCHPDDVPCPKCPFLVEKACICGKQRMKNRPCWLEETRCGLPCGKKLKCGTHTCRKECHRPGECEDAEIPGSHCAQPCGKTRKSCEHSCQDVCHAPYQCKEDRPCQSKTFITCDCQNRKKEVKCLATKTNPTPERDVLKCDDECLRLQRNQRLAAALNVDPDHTDDHVPYSDTTLKLFRDLSLNWVQTQEREFRVFASEPSEKRLRFKPMPKAQRAFLHNLAADFGFDSESQDPEPHRHVSVFKTPRFVSAPKKTLAHCVKIRSDAAKSAPAPSSSANASAAPEPFNALLLTAPRFGLTIDEVESALASHLKAHNTLSFTTSFLPSDEILIRAVPVTSWGTTPSAIESSLASLKPLVTRTITKEGLAASAILVNADANLNVLRREGAAAGAGAGGWNAVVGRAAAQRRAFAPAKPAETRSTSGFVSFSKLARKKVVEDSVADDWEAAAEDE
ncbi:NF-X1 type zinc finger [Colletotrichum karsti]|uniref:NF-X1 type zinc finger n=1 Tax=Colletotrichum karsti TaxID=1095194 RepID=A0A9P6LKB1_9PEZI|nr:NF-X1 type zinc finger [Colletotrichum karsti]KAF9879194.1 NF-X1 type zinc finger [Colletotrichum karsti]